MGGWTLDDAEAICDVGGETDVLRHLAALVDKSLVQKSNAHDEPRFTMLETVREYALERLEERGEAKKIHRRHASFYLQLAEEEEQASRGPLQRGWLDRLEAEHDNLRAALEWSLTSQNDIELGLQLTGALSHFWYVRDHHNESRVWLERALRSDGNAGGAARAKVLVSAGRLAWFQGEFARVNELVEESLTLYRRLGDDAGAAFALLVLGRTAVSQGDLARGQTLVEESLGVFRQQGNTWGIARAFIVLGDRNLFEGAVERAEFMFRKGLKIARDLEDAEGIALSLLYLGRAAHMRGDDTHASALLEDSLKVFEASHDSRGVAEVLLEMGRVTHSQGDDKQALAVCRRSLDRSRKLDNKTQIAFCLTLAGEILASRDTARATSLFGAAEALLRSLDAALDPSGSLGYERNLANARMQLGEEAFARAWQRGKSMTLGQAMDQVVGDDA
jgi:tetratricopeptide (TPR) repeat protein